MSIVDRIPVLRGTGTRRAVDAVERLREENVDHLTWRMAADDFFQRLTADRDGMYACWQDERQQRLNAEETAAHTQSERDQLAEENAELRRQLAPFLAVEANANAVTVPPMVRDTTAVEDQATGPIDVRALWEARDAGLLGPVTNPGHIHRPTWARRD